MSVTRFGTEVIYYTSGCFCIYWMEYKHLYCRTMEKVLLYVLLVLFKITVARLVPIDAKYALNCSSIFL